MKVMSQQIELHYQAIMSPDELFEMIIALRTHVRDYDAHPCIEQNLEIMEKAYIGFLPVWDKPDGENEYEAKQKPLKEAKPKERQARKKKAKADEE